MGKKTAIAAGLLVLLLTILLVLPVVPALAGFVSPDVRTVFKVAAGGAAAVLLVVKEVLSAFSRDPSMISHKTRLGDWAAICGLFGTVFGVPALFAALFVTN